MSTLTVLLIIWFGLAICSAWLIYQAEQKTLDDIEKDERQKHHC